MCGIAGFIGKTNISDILIKKTLTIMKNRGPDVQNAVKYSIGDININLLHSRLSIIDIDRRSDQPFSIGNHTIVFNGEIYNFIELRNDLKQSGVIFRTDSDTEVLLQAYIHYGPSFVDKCEGMWSFAIADTKTGEVLLSRDRFAEKPLYYMKTDDGFFFASEIKFIRALSGFSLKINKKHIYRYLVNGYRSLYKTNETFFEEITELSYGTNILISPGSDIRIYRYWKPDFMLKEMTLKEAIEGFRERLMESVRIRLRSDVPLAFCLSGGVDSSSIASIAAKIYNYDVATFSIIESDERYNEYDNIKATIDDISCRHELIEIPKADFFDRMKKLIEYHDSPVSTISYYLHSFLSEAIAKAGFRVALSGTGADELVTGYYDHFLQHLYEMKGHKDYNQALHDWDIYVSGYIRNPYLKDPDLFIKNRNFRDHIFLNRNEFLQCMKEDFQEDFFETEYCDSLLRNRMLNELFEEAVPVVLHEDDLNSMFYSIENRSPYLDSRLFSFSYSIPPEYLIRNGYAKYPLRKAVKGILNEKVRTCRKKVGFNASIHSLVDLASNDITEYLLDNSAIYDYVKRDEIEKFIKIKPMPNSFSKFFFSFINVKIFLEINN